MIISSLFADVIQYVIGSPLFKKATIYLENGNEFEINAVNNSKNNFYIQGANLNGRSYDKTFLRFEDIQKGGKLKFDLGNTPNKEWATKRKSVPYSLSNE